MRATLLKRVVALSVSGWLPACGGTPSGPSGSSLPKISVTPDGAAIVGVTVVGFSAEPAGSTSARYAWDFGDGERGTGQSVSHRYEATGDFPVVMTVTDGSATSSDAMSIRVGSLSGSWSTRDQSGPAFFGFRFELTQRGGVLEGGVYLMSLCPTFGGSRPPPFGTIDGTAASPRRLAWTLVCAGQASDWVGEADPSLDVLRMSRTGDPPSSAPRVYYREPS